jgi:5'-3' exonuclease
VARAGPLVHLIDAPVWIFRAWFSLPEMEAPDGTPTNAAYGFANTLIKYLGEREPSHLATAFDHHPVYSFRSRIFPAYKAQRGEPPEELEVQFDLCLQVAAALGAAVFEKRDYEADDLIATLATQVLRKGGRAVVVSSDKDLTQLVREDGRVGFDDYARGETLDADGVRERFGVSPEQIPDYLGLAGDAVDNLPGVPGVGPKGAVAALRAFGRIEEVPAELERWQGVDVRGVKRLAGLVDEHREQALLTRELATLVRDVPGVKADLRGLRFRGADRAAVETLFERLGWDGILERVPLWASQSGRGEVQKAPKTPLDARESG